MREREIEKYLVQEIKKYSGVCWKWTGTSGAPDRIIFINNRVFFVELKNEKGTVSPLQKLIHRKMANLGFIVHVLNSKEAVDKFIMEEITC